MEPIKYRPSLTIMLLLSIAAYALIAPLAFRLLLLVSPHGLMFLGLGSISTILFLILAFIAVLVLVQALNNLYLMLFQGIPFRAFKVGFTKSLQLFYLHHTVPVPLGGYVRAMRWASFCTFIVFAGLVPIFPSIYTLTASLIALWAFAFSLYFTWPVRKYPRDWIVVDTKELGFDLYPPEALVPAPATGLPGPDGSRDGRPVPPDGPPNPS